VKMTVTLIGEGQARKGYEFVYVGPLAECKECKYKTVCFNLDPGRRYVVSGIRDKKHPCKVHEGDVQVVEVNPAPIPMAVDEKIAVEGSTVSIEKRTCNDLSCAHYKMCNPDVFDWNKKYKIEKVVKTLKCSQNYRLKEVLLI